MLLNHSLEFHQFTLGRYQIQDTPSMHQLNFVLVNLPLKCKLNSAAGRSDLPWHKLVQQMIISI